MKMKVTSGAWSRNSPKMKAGIMQTTIQSFVKNVSNSNVFYVTNKVNELKPQFCELRQMFHVKQKGPTQLATFRRDMAGQTKWGTKKF